MWNMVQRLHSRTSAVQSITPGDAGNAPTRSKKRVKRSPLPITVQVSQPAPAPPRRTSARKRNDRSQSTTTAQLARAPNMRSTRSRIVSSSREYLVEKERAEEETDGNLQAIDLMLLVMMTMEGESVRTRLHLQQYSLLLLETLGMRQQGARNELNDPHCQSLYKYRNQHQHLHADTPA